MLSKESPRRSSLKPTTPPPLADLRQSALWPAGRLTHNRGQLCARHGEYTFTPGRGVACCMMASRGEEVEPRFPEWWDQAVMDLRPWNSGPHVAAAAATLALLFVLILGTGRALAQQVVNGGATKEFETQTLSISGNTLTFQDATGTQTETFEIKVNGGPATLTVTINGCMNGGTCEAVGASTGLTSQIIHTTGGPYDNYQVIGTWTGGASPSLNVRRLATTARKYQTPPALDMRNFPPVLYGGDLGAAAAAACASLGPNGGYLDARGLTYPLYIKTQPYSGCNTAIQFVWNAGDIYTSVPIVIPNQRGGMAGTTIGTGTGQTPGTMIHFCNSGGPNGCGANPNNFPNATPNTIAVGGPYLIDPQAAAGTCASMIPSAAAPCNATPLIVMGGDATLGQPKCNLGSFGETLTNIGLDSNQVDNSVGIFSCAAQENTWINQVQVSQFTLAGMVFDATYTTTPNPSHRSLNTFTIHAGGGARTTSCANAIGAISRANTGVVTVVCTAPMLYVPKRHQPFFITAASDPTFAGIYIVCTSADSATCVTPTTSTFSYLQSSVTVASTTGTATTQFRTDGYVEEMFNAQNAITECCFATVVGNTHAEDVNDTWLYNGMWISGGNGGTYQSVHFENIQSDAVVVGANEATSSRAFISFDFGGATVQPAGSSLFKLKTNATGMTLINARQNTPTRFIVTDDASGQQITANTLPGQSLPVWSQNTISGPACYKTGASPLACANTSTGIVTIAVGAAAVTVNTTAVTALSSISLSTNTSAAAVTATGAASCTPTALQAVNVSAVVAGTSFTINVPANVAGNPECVNFTIRN